MPNQYQSEDNLEKQLIKQLVNQDYKFVEISSNQELLNNLKNQLEIHNKTKFTDKEFERIMNILKKGNVFEKAGILRGKQVLKRENGENEYIEFFNSQDFCSNQYQVTNQVTINGTYKNRYDVTILINGLPLVQIELKRRGLELKEAFNQINRYQKHTYWAESGLFNYVQIFVISNGVDTKYMANNKSQTFDQTFFWTDVENKLITNLEQFTSEFLEKCHLSKMIAKYIVLHQTNKILMVLRPYQFYAVESIVDLIKKTNKNGYIWHTTGSGKTLTSFKASQIIHKLPEIDKVFFVVDRKDLDDQTVKEYNNFQEGSVDGLKSTKSLAKQITKANKIIVTTIQKLNTAITREKYSNELNSIKEKKIVFIFDECHRSQFGQTHKAISKFFTNSQMIGFTGTPILEKNAFGSGSSKQTTKDLFHKCLHKYVITDAIRDDNVLRFSIEYVGKYKQKEDSKNNLDIKIDAIDEKEIYQDKKRLEKITDYIIDNHKAKTHNKKYTGMFAVSSIEVLRKYYELFRQKKLEGKTDLKIATIFSYGQNEEENVDYVVNEEGLNEEIVLEHSREALEGYIKDYNKEYGTSFSTKDSKSFDAYNIDLIKRIKNKGVDIVIVVGMFLTGFDSKKLNTLYVDKNLQYHGLIQAFSRTNRTDGVLKSFGNIVCFRNLKNNVDDAIALFSNPESKDTITVETMENYIIKFNEKYLELIDFVKNPDAVNELVGENELYEFVKKFRNLMRLKNELSNFADFDMSKTDMESQEFEDFASKYSTINDKVNSIKKESEKVSVLEDLDFEIKLIHKDEINIDYILNLINQVGASTINEKQEKIDNIKRIIQNEPSLRTKRELIEEFLSKYSFDEDLNVVDQYYEFMEEKRMERIEELSEELRMEPEKFKDLLDDCVYRERLPSTSGEILDIVRDGQKPSILFRGRFIKQAKEKIKEFIDIFVS